MEGQLNVQAGMIGFGDVIAALSFTTEPGGLRIDDKFQPQIQDIQRQNGVLHQRVQDLPATGQPSRWIEQTAWPSGHTFVATNALTVASPGTPNRVEKSLYLKALIGGMNNSMFNVEITQQQQTFSGLEAKDFNDSIKNMVRTHGKALWRGTSTGPTDSVGLQYAGVFNQLATGGNLYTMSIASGVSIVEKFNLAIAQIMGQEDIDVTPTASYWHPLAYEALQREMETKETKFNQVEVLPGKRVNAIATQAGDIPVVSDPWMGKVQITNPNDAFPVFITDENLLEYHYVTTTDIRVFELGLAAGLGRQRVMVKFGGFVIKNPDVAHALLKIADDWVAP